MKKIFRKIHLWLSIPFGLIISIICLSGAALVFETEITEMCYPNRFFVEKTEGGSIPVGKLMAKVSATLPDSVSITGVNVSADPARAYQVNLSKPRRASVYINQYTGEITGRSERMPFFTVAFRLHRWLLDSMKPDGGIFWGKMIVGVSTLLFIFILITGIIIWIPRSAKALKNRLKIVVNKSQHRFWYDLHVSGGMYVLLFLLAMALTGLTWSFPWYRAGFYKVFGVEIQQQGLHGAPHTATVQQGSDRERPRGESASGNREERSGRGNYRDGEKSHGGERRGGRAFRHWQQVLDELNESNPGYKQINISNGTASVSFNRMGNQRAADKYIFDAVTGEVTETQLYKEQDKSGKIRGWIYSVHVGNWGGMLTRVLTFFAALLGGTLPLTGYYLWIKKFMVKRKVRR